MEYLVFLYITSPFNKTRKPMPEPIAIFDKLFLESLNPTEAKVFDILFQSNMTPIFFVEVLGDLEKKGKTPEEQEKIVARLSRKTPQRNYYANVNHHTLCIGELLSSQISMQEVPVCYPAKEVEIEGKKHAFHDEPPELSLFNKWQKGEFKHQERTWAQQYRRLLEEIPESLPPLFDISSCSEFQQTSSKFEDCKTYAYKKIYQKISDQDLINKAITFLGVTPREKKEIIERWQTLGFPSFYKFAPYTMYVMFVHFFFQVASLKDASRGRRKSNWIDLAYLYYLPFTKIFISGDKLHKNIVPLFLNQNTQRFISSQEMKEDLKLLVQYFNTHPDRPLGDITKISNLQEYLPKGSMIHNLYTSIYGENWQSFYENLINKIDKKNLDKMSKEMAEIHKAGEDKIQKGEFVFSQDSHKAKTVSRKFNIHLEN